MPLCPKRHAVDSKCHLCDFDAAHPGYTIREGKVVDRGVVAKSKRTGKYSGSGHTEHVEVPCWRTIAQQIRSGVVLKRRGKWQDHQNFRKAYGVISDGVIAGIKDYDQNRYAGRGVVISAGGRYLIGAYVTIKMLRHLGCRYPIQVWYLGDRGEADRRFDDAVEPLGVTPVDADIVRKSQPWRILNGFESKLFAVFHSPFDQVMYLDADCYPVAPVEYLFDHADFKQTGGIYWADAPQTEQWTKWPHWSVEPFGPKCGFETGQYVLDKRIAWRQLNLACWYDQHSDYYYGDGTRNGDYGDKGPHRVAWAKFKTAPTIWNLIPTWAGESYIHQDDQKRPVFVHRCRNKFAKPSAGFKTTPQTKDGPIYFPDVLPMEDVAWGYYREAMRILG